MSIRIQLRQIRARRKAFVDLVAEQFSNLIWWVFCKVDRYFSRTDDPSRQQQPRSWLLAPTLLFYFLLFGPCPRWEDASWWRRISMALALGAFFGCGCLLDRWRFPKQLDANGHRRSRVLFLCQFCGVACFFLFSLILVIAQDILGNVRESDQWAYPHIWHPLALLVFIAGLFRRPGSPMLCSTAYSIASTNPESIFRALLLKADRAEPDGSRLFGRSDKATMAFFQRDW